MPDLTMTMLFARDLTGLGVELPAGAQLALDVHDTALAAATAHPGADLEAALNNGTMTPDNVGELLLSAAVAATARDKAHALLRDLQMPLVRRFARAVRGDADRLITDLRKVFTPAAKVVQRAGSLFPVGATGEQVLAAGDQAAATWRELEQARRTLDTCHAVRVTMARDYGIGPASSDVLMFVRGLGSEQELARAAQAWDTSGARWHALTAAGFELSLPDPEQIAATRAAIEQTAQAAADRQRAEHARQVAEQSPPWLFPTPLDTAPGAA